MNVGRRAAQAAFGVLALLAAVTSGCGDRTLLRVDVTGDRPFDGVTLRLIATRAAPSTASHQADFSGVTFSAGAAFKAGLFLPDDWTGAVTIVGKVIGGGCESAAGMVTAPDVRAHETNAIVNLRVQTHPTCIGITDAGAVADGGGGGSGGASGTGGGAGGGGRSGGGSGGGVGGGVGASGGSTGGGGQAGGAGVSGSGGATGGRVGSGGGGGGLASGGAVGSGGRVGTGGAATGGASTGGASSGGVVGSGGRPATGGASSGGAVGSGGRAATGGASSGGAPGSGGASSGGAPGSGGVGGCICAAPLLCLPTGLCGCPQTNASACGTRVCGYATNLCGQSVPCGTCAIDQCCLGDGSCRPPGNPPLCQRDLRSPLGTPPVCAAPA